MTPKTLDKYIAKLKKQYADEGWSLAVYKNELNKMFDEMADQYYAGTITLSEFEKAKQKINNAESKPELQGKKQEAAPAKQDTQTTYSALYDWLVDISDDEIDSMDAMSLTDMVEYLKKSNVSAEQAKKQLESAVDLIKNNGFSADAAMNVAAGYTPGMKPGQAAKAPAGMSQDEYYELGEDLKKKVKAGLITKEEYAKLYAKLNTAYFTDHKTAEAAAKEIGCDPGTKATDEAVIKLGKEFKKVYSQAALEMQEQLKEFTDKYQEKLAKMQAKVAAGEMTQAELLTWMNGQQAMMNVLKQKIDQASGVMLNANQKAMAMINHEMLGVFAENANWQSYQLTQDTGVSLMFSIYDENTVEKLIQYKPELLPRKEVNGVKDKAWNQKRIANSVTQAIIQGESIPKLAKRIAAETGQENGNAMTRYARTAMTGAQNSGRIEMLHRAQGMGIKCKKVWLATLDSRTRDSHQKMDGVSVGVDEDFVTPLGSKMKYPGDIAGKGGDVWNCRCTLVYDYDGFPNDATTDMRRDNETGQEIANMDYGEWKAAKEASVLNDLNTAKFELAEAQKEYVEKKVSETKQYKDIWKDPVTLADYPAKKGSIQAKKDYYTAEIEKYKQAKAAGSSWATDEKIKEFEKKKRSLAEFEKHGQILEKRNAALQKVQDLYSKAGIGKAAAAPAVAKKAAKKAAKASGGTNTGDSQENGQTDAQTAKKMPFGPEDYTKERKDKALWTTDKKKVDSMMRDRTGEVWRNATAAERDAIYEYTQSYHKYNEPLRGIEYGTNRYVGVGNTDLNAGTRRNGKRLNAMTDIIDRCSYDHDQWLQRGVGFGGMDKFFNVSEHLLRYGSERELQQALLGTTPTEYGFMSMGSAKGQGFSGNILMNIYAPAGTKMMYVEPFSAFSGSRDHMSWDGKSKQSSFGHEFETIMQQGTQFRVTKVERQGNGTIYIDLEVINQDNQQRWK